MDRDFIVRKRAILVVLGLVLGADGALAFYSYQMAAAPHTTQKEFDAQNLRLKVLRGDIKSARDIKNNMPSTRADCEKFEHSLPSASTSSSAMISDLDEIAKKAGLQIIAVSNKQKPVEGRGLTEVQIDATVSGDYGSVARFVNGIQRSEKFYILDGLAVAADTQKQEAAAGLLRVGIHLRTYLREAA